MQSTSQPGRRPRLVVVAPDVVGAVMAGPGIRFAKIAEKLSNVAEVTLAVGIEGSTTAALAGRGYDVVAYADREELIDLVSSSDIAYCQLIDEDIVRRGVASGCRFIFDLYNALPAEAIGAERIGGFTTQPEMDDVYSGVLSFFRFCMSAGSYFVTSNERQRDFWIGYMLASGALLPSELRGRAVSDIIGLAPFGMEDSEPVAASRAIRDAMGLGDDAFVLLWAGGIWDWFDAETPIRAMAALQDGHPDAHLVFYGTRHPNASIGVPATVARAQELASELGVLGVTVHFVDGWVPAERRADYLMDADVAISAHKQSFETRYAFRTRVLDHFWAGIPSLVTEGDWFADYIRDERLGVVVPYGDVPGMTAGIVAMADEGRRSSIAESVRAIRDDWRWERTTAELRRVVADWERLLHPRTLPPIATEHVADAPAVPHPRRRRMRTALARTPIGSVYRALMGRLRG